MEFIAGLLLMPVVFYSLIVVCFLAIALGIDNEKGEGWGWATLGSAGLIYLLGSFFGVTFEAIKAAPIVLAIGAVAYIVVGVLWSFAKWYFKLTGIRDTFIELKSKYRKIEKLPENFLQVPQTAEQCLTKEDRQAREEICSRNADFATYVNNTMKRYESIRPADAAIDPSLIAQSIKPVASLHKSTITQWIAFWPISFTWTMINDPVRKIANYIFSRIKGTFQRMSDSMFAGV